MVLLPWQMRYPEFIPRNAHKKVDCKQFVINYLLYQTDNGGDQTNLTLCPCSPDGLWRPVPAHQMPEASLQTYFAVEELPQVTPFRYSATNLHELACPV